MPQRIRLFLTFAVLCISPLLVLSLISFRSDLKNCEILLRNNLDDELAASAAGFQSVMDERVHELQALANGPVGLYVSTARSPEAVAAIDPGVASAQVSEAVNVARKAVSALPFAKGYYGGLACFDPQHHPMFLAEPGTDQTTLLWRTKDFLPGQLTLDERVWSASANTFSCAVVRHATFGQVYRCTLPVRTPEISANARGALVADLRLDALFASAVRGWEAASDRTTNAHLILAVDAAGEIIYHTNVALNHQQLSAAMPYLAPVAASMKDGQAGSTFYVSSDGDQWIEAHLQLRPEGLSLAVARNYSLATPAARRTGWL